MANMELWYMASTKIMTLLRKLGGVSLSSICFLSNSALVCLDASSSRHVAQIRLSVSAIVGNLTTEIFDGLGLGANGDANGDPKGGLARGEDLPVHYPLHRTKSIFNMAY